MMNKTDRIEEAEVVETTTMPDGGKVPEPENIEQYSSEYSESKLWEKIRGVARQAGKKCIHYVLCCYYLLLSPDVPMSAKSILIGALGYFILPLDLIPDLFPVVGFTDDLAAILAAIKTVKNNLTPEIEAQAAKKLSEWFE